MKIDEQLPMADAYKKIGRIKSFYMHVAAYVSVNSMLIILWAVQQTIAPSFWQVTFFITLCIAGLGLLGHALWLFGPGLLMSSKWEARKLKELMDKKGTQ